jgi:aldehyde dehydrogenase family 7 member A1
VIVMPDADLSLAVPSTFFGAVGTAGQRCTSTRRIYVHRSIAPTFLSQLTRLYKTLLPGDPLDPKTLLGPLHTPRAVATYTATLDQLRAVGAEILVGGTSYDAASLPAHLQGGNYVRPTLAVPPATLPLDHTLWQTETFAPVTCVSVFDRLEEAVEWNNGVRQGLSSSLWTRDVRHVGKWLGLGGGKGSDCGIVNVSLREITPPFFFLLSFFAPLLFLTGILRSLCDIPLVLLVYSFHLSIPPN